jgi:hypothetical protein
VTPSTLERLSNSCWRWSNIPIAYAIPAETLAA